MKVYLDDERTPMHRRLRLIRSCLAIAALLTALSGRAASLLLPVTTAVPPFNVTVVCRGLQVRDADTAVLLRSFPGLGCVRAVAAAGERRAVVVAGASTFGDPTDDAVRLIELDHGTVLGSAALDPVPGFHVLWVRALTDNAFLVGLIQSSSDSVQTRFVRVDFDGSTLRIRADATVPGIATASDSGDVITARRSTANGIAIDEYRTSDLAAIGSVVFDQPAGISSATAEVRGDRMYAVLRGGPQPELRVVDATSGALIRRLPWPSDLELSSAHDEAGRLLATHATRQADGRYRIDLVAVGLDDGVETPLGSRLAASPYVSVAHRDGRTVVLTQIFGLCSLFCSPDPPLDYAITVGPDLRVLGGEPMGVAPNSAQFLAPTLLPGGADTVPSATPTGLALLALALFALAGRSLSARAAAQRVPLRPSRRLGRQ